MKLDLLPKNENIIQVNGPYGRTYKYNGVELPSVSTILSAISDKKFLDNWRNKIGYQQAEWQTKQAGNYGTFLHKTMEEFLLEGKLPSSKQMLQETAVQRKLFEKAIIRAVELRLFSESIGAAGTVDCIAEINGKTFVFDFKIFMNSMHPNKLAKYRLQAGFYGMMAEETYGLDITQVVILAKKPNNPLVIKAFDLNDELRSNVFETMEAFRRLS